jgi:tRNA threonylcarbamoyladenosine biosynthesis protein TsaE
VTALIPAKRSIATPEAMHDFGVSLAAELGAGDVVVLTGELGAGKTTFTRGLGEGLGVRGAVTSPTFVLARTHPSLRGGPDLVHVDAYRLSSALELDDLDIDFAAAIVVIEWGAGLVDELTDSYLAITLDRPRGAGVAADLLTAGPGAESGSDVDSDVDVSVEPIEPRTVTIEFVGPRWAEYPRAESARPESPPAVAENRTGSVPADSEGLADGYGG